MKRLIKYLYHFVMCFLGSAFVGILSIAWLNSLQTQNNNPFDTQPNPPGVLALILFGTVFISVLLILLKRLVIRMRSHMGLQSKIVFSDKPTLTTRKSDAVCY